MPYIKIKCYPKDSETKNKVVDEINDIFLKYWGCSKEAISISLEEVLPESWDNVIKQDIEPDEDKMYIMAGEKKYI